MMRQRSFVSLFVFLLATTMIQAHYPWIKVTSGAGKQRSADLYFEEAPRPGDGEYLDPFLKRSKTWVRTVKQPKPTVLELKEKKVEGNRWMSAPLKEQAPLALDNDCLWGVYRYPGNLDVLLHYYSRHLSVNKQTDLDKLATASHLTFDVVPSMAKDKIELTVLWKGKPLKDCPVNVYGPKLRESLKTDDQGKVSFVTKQAGLHRLRTLHDVHTPGTYEKKEYSRVRHQCTLTMILPLKK